MSLSLEPESRFRRISAWGLESGGLRAASILVVAALSTAFSGVLARDTGLRIDPAALGATFCALEVGLARGLILAASIGYIADVSSGQPRGLWTFGTVVAYGVLRLFVIRVVGARAGTVMILTALAAGTAYLARWGLELLTGNDVGLWGVRMMLGVAGTTLLGYPAFVVYGWASDRFRSREDTLFR
ncbi:MAG: hypothetical protein AAFZ18_26175 [Myxococcota bacterium]